MMSCGLLDAVMRSSTHMAAHSMSLPTHASDGSRQGCDRENMADDGRPWPLAIVIDLFHFLDLSASFVTQNCRGTGERRSHPPASQPRDGRAGQHWPGRWLGRSSELIGRTFLKPKEQDGARLRATIVSLVDDIDKGLARQPGLIRLRCLVGDQQIEEIIAYDQIGEFIEQQTEFEEGTWKYRAIIGHQGPFTARNKKEYRGSPYDLLIEWETGECT